MTICLEERPRPLRTSRLMIVTMSSSNTRKLAEHNFLRTCKNQLRVSAVHVFRTTGSSRYSIYTLDSTLLPCANGSVERHRSCVRPLWHSGLYSIYSIRTRKVPQQGASRASRGDVAHSATRVYMVGDSDLSTTLNMLINFRRLNSMGKAGFN